MTHQEAIEQIKQWCEAYPEEVFTPLSDGDLKIAGMVLRASGIDIGAMHAEWARHIMAGISKIIGEIHED